MFSLDRPMGNVTPGQAHFMPQSHNLNILERGQLGDVTYKYKGSRLCGVRQDFFLFSLYNPM